MIPSMIGRKTEVVEPSDDSWQTRTTDLPDVLIFRNVCQALLRKIFRFSRSANQVYVGIRPALHRRAYRDRHDTWRGMRWTRRYRRRAVPLADGKAVWS